MSTILTCAACSWLAYGSEGLPPGCAVPWTDIQAVADGFTCVTLEKEIVLAFRGTADFGDVLEDLDLFRHHPEAELDPGIFVHRGFCKRYAGYAPKCAELVSRFLKDHPGAFVTCTGHSSGAAVATLCAYDLTRELPEENIRCITFGSPPLGNAWFVTKFVQRVTKSIRVVHKRDPIPKQLSMYTHVPCEQRVFGPSVVKDWTLWIKHILRWLFGKYDPIDLHYHTLEVYIMCLAQSGGEGDRLLDAPGPSLVEEADKEIAKEIVTMENAPVSLEPRPSAGEPDIRTTT